MSNADLHSLRFLYRNHDLTDEEQWEREVERGDMDYDLEKNDLESHRRPDLRSDNTEPT